MIQEIWVQSVINALSGHRMDGIPPVTFLRGRQDLHLEWRGNFWTMGEMQ